MTIGRQKRYFLIAAIFVVAAFAISICVGRYPIAPRDIWSILSGQAADDLSASVFWTLRLPRTLMALLAGLGLGMAGSVYQTIFKNPLASPDIIGVANGSTLGAAIAIVLFGNHTLSVAVSAFAGGMLVTVLVLLLVRSIGSPNTSTYILSGIILKALSESGIMLLKTYADPARELAAIEFWSMGSFAGITLAKLMAILPFFLIGFGGLILLRRQVALLGLEDDESRSLGVQVALMRVVVLGFSTLMISSIICLTGIIGFVGLIAPHIARLVLKRTGFAACLLSALAGAFILLVADMLARQMGSAEIPISILTTLIGVPFMVYFMRKRRLMRP